MKLNWKGKITKILVLSPQERSKNMNQNLTVDTGTWDPEKKASGIKDVQPIEVACGIFVRHKWWTFLRIQDIRYSRGQARWAVEYSRRKRIETPSTSMRNMATLTCYTGLFMPRTSSVSMVQSQSGVDRNPEKQAKADQKRARKMSPEIQRKQEDLKS